jgi:hypothetical protein
MNGSWLNNKGKMILLDWNRNFVTRKDNNHKLFRKLRKAKNKKHPRRNHRIKMKRVKLNKNKT